MGRYSYGGKDTVEGAQKIELPWLKRQGFFDPSSSFRVGNLTWSRNGEPTGNVSIQVSISEGDSYIRFIYRSKGYYETEWTSRDYRFPLEKLPCRYGGFKWFVRCQLTKNGIYCGRRARILYLTNGYFGCRDCANLTYQSCNYGGRYKGFVSIPDLEEQEMRVKRRHYAGKPTRQYRKLLKMDNNFNRGMIGMYLSLQKLGKKKKR